MKKSLILAAMALTFAACNNTTISTESNMNNTLQLTQEWDKVFPKSEKVDHKKVTFHNRYGITLAADMRSEERRVGKEC